ncbi:MAG TPA: hypothetical protein VF483_07065 [Gemmatimonadaceae bacterium]
MTPQEAHARRFCADIGVNLDDLADFRRRGPLTPQRERVAYLMRATPMPSGKRPSWPKIANGMGFGSHTGARTAARRYAKKNGLSPL